MSAPVAEVRKLDVLTNSALKDARACPRLYEMRDVLGYRAAAAQVLRFGTLWHAGQEEWWRAPGGERLQRALAALAAHEADPFDRAKAEALLLGYDAVWSEEPYETLGVEVPFECDLVNPETGAKSKTWRLAGKIDAIVRSRRDGQTYIVEHKTSSEDVSPGSTYYKRLRLDSQVSIYYVGARSLGFDVAGCIYDVVKKPGLKPYQVNQRRAVAETPDEYRTRVAEAVAEDLNGFFQRAPVVRLERDMEEAMRDVWVFASYLRDCVRTSTFPRNPDACVRFNQTCAFWPVCAGEDSLDNTSRYQLVGAHPELAESPAA